MENPTQENLLKEIFAIPSQVQVSDRFNQDQAACRGDICKSGVGCMGIINE